MSRTWDEGVGERSQTFALKRIMKNVEGADLDLVR